MPTTSPIVRYKKKLITTITNSASLVQLLNSTYVEDGECVDSDELVYKQIFPYHYVPETQTEVLSYVTMRVNGLGMKNKIYNKAEVYIYVISHQDCMKTTDGGTRIDLMGEIVEDLFNGKDSFGFGEMELKSNIEGYINNTHKCRELRFLVEDFNADACRDGN